MSDGIDVNRGVMIQRHPSMGLVYMYIDTPGVYLNTFGKEVPEKVAAQAYFDIEELGKEKQKRERMAKAMTAIEIELELAITADEETILWERDGYRVVKLSHGKAYVFDDENNKLTPIAIPQEEAKILLDHLVPEAKEANDGGAKT